MFGEPGGEFFNLQPVFRSLNRQSEIAPASLSLDRTLEARRKETLELKTECELSEDKLGCTSVKLS